MVELKPYVNPPDIKDELKPNKHKKEGASRRINASSIEVVGRGRDQDWFRGTCANCDEKYITFRDYNQERFFKCTHCGQVHSVSSGPFSLSVADIQPIKPEETGNELYRAKLINTRKDSETPRWYYGNRDWVHIHEDDLDYEVVQENEKV